MSLVLAIGVLSLAASMSPGESLRTTLAARMGRPIPDGGLASYRVAEPRAALETAPFRPGVVLIGFSPGVSSARQQAIEHAAGVARATRVGPAIRAQRSRTTRRPLPTPLSVRVPASGVLAAVGRLRSEPGVAYAEPDYLMSASAVPNDPSFALQWGDENTGQSVPTQNANEELGSPTNGMPGADDRALAAWGVSSGSRSIVIGETDTGVDYNHADLQANIWSNPGGIGGCAAATHGYDVLNDTCEPMDDDNVYGGHGTHVAGIMGAVGDNGIGVTGMNWQTSILPVKWLDSQAEGSTSGLISALQWLVAAKQAGVNIRVVNDSATFVGTAYSQALSEEIDTLAQNNILFVTAAGNTGNDNDEEAVRRYPCGYDRPSEICVTASNDNDQLPSWANYGAHTVQLAAPGVSIYSTLRNGSYGYLSGGSMASPQVAGAAALILSVKPSLSTSELRADILENVDKLPTLEGKVITGGRLDVCKAMPGCSRGRQPTVTTSAASSLTQTSATLNGMVNPNGGAVTDCHFDYGTSESYGFSVPCASLPGSGSSAVAVSALAESLSANTTYHFRIVATNSGGTSYGDEQALTTEVAAAPLMPQGPGSQAPSSAQGVLSTQEHRTPPISDAELASTTLHVSSSGTLSVKVICPVEDSGCAGTVRLWTFNLAGVGATGHQPRKRKVVVLIVASGSFTVIGRRVAAVKLRLSAEARALLAHIKVLHARATIVARDPSGTTHRTQTTVTLLAPNATRNGGKG